MEGFHYEGSQSGGDDARRGYSASFGNHEHLQQHYHTLRRSRSMPADKGATATSSVAAAPPLPRSLPGFATFLQQSPPHHERNSVASEQTAVSSSARRQPRGIRECHSQQHELHHRRDRHFQHTTSNSSNSATSAFSAYSHLMDSVDDSIARTQSYRSSWSDASGGSPNLSDFKHIAINRSASNGAAPSSYHIGGRGCSSSTASEPARTQTNCKPTTNRTSVNIGVPPTQQQQRPPARTSRYLREIDRREILRRIEQGEKQANLAKEYQVSRAAISNLKQRRNNRNRKDQRLVRSARASEEKREYETHRGGGNYQQQLQQLRKQFKRGRLVFSGNSNQTDHHHQHSHAGSAINTVYSNERYYSADEQDRSPSPVSSPSAALPYPEPKFTAAMEETFEKVLELKTAALEILLTRLIDPCEDAQTKQTSKSRIARLLLERTIGEFPARDFQVSVGTPNSSSSAGTSPAYYLGAELTKSTCAVKIASDSGSEVAAVLLREFEEIEPFCEVGSISFTSDSSLSRQRRAGEDEYIVHLPQSIHESNVLLLVDFLDPRSSEEVAKALQVILRSGVRLRDICLVAICSHERALRYLLELFPQLRIIAAKVLLQGDPSSIDIGDLLHSRLLF